MGLQDDIFFNSTFNITDVHHVKNKTIYLDHFEILRKHMHSFCLQQTSLKYVNKHRDRKFYRTEYKVAEMKVLRIPSLVQIVNTIKIQVIRHALLQLAPMSQNFKRNIFSKIKEYEMETFL